MSEIITFVEKTSLYDLCKKATVMVDQKIEEIKTQKISRFMEMFNKEVRTKNKFRRFFFMKPLPLFTMETTKDYIDKHQGNDYGFYTLDYNYTGLNAFKHTLEGLIICTRSYATKKYIRIDTDTLSSIIHYSGTYHE